MRRNQLPEEMRRERKRIAYRIGEETLKRIILALVGIIVVVLALFLLAHD